MWVLSVDAGSLLSVVKFDQKKAGAKALAEKHKATDPDVDYMLVRARVKQSLGYVVEVLNALSEDIEGYEPPIIESMPSADYKYRTIVSRDEWKRYLMFEVDGIDYDSHVKEETVRRQPEPKIPNLYSALSGTWSLWAKLQDTPPYGGKVWTSGSYGKPDCKNCGHRELAHTIKGDKCCGSADGMWTEARQKTSTCKCEKYEPKPAPAKTAPPALPAGSAKGAVGESAPDPVYPSSIFGSDWDVDDDVLTEAWAIDEQGVAHHAWCSVWDGDSCICIEGEPTDDEMWEGSVRVTKSAVEEETPADGTVLADGSGVWIDGRLVEQEPPVAGESRKARKARNERNRRARRRARMSPAAS